MNVHKKASGAYEIVAPARAGGDVSFDLCRSEDEPRGTWKLSGNTKAAAAILGDPERALSFEGKREALLYVAGAIGCTCSQRAGHHADNCATMMRGLRKPVYAVLPFDGSRRTATLWVVVDMRTRKPVAEPMTREKALSHELELRAKARRG